MMQTIRRELRIPQPAEQVWRALTNSTTLTFRVPPNPKIGFEGLVAHCEVMECEPPSRLVFSWSVGGPVANTRVSFRLEPDGEGTRVFFEHSGFDRSQPRGDQAFKGAGFGWAKMLGQLAVVVGRLSSDTKS